MWVVQVPWEEVLHFIELNEMNYQTYLTLRQSPF